MHKENKWGFHCLDDNTWTISVPRQYPKAEWGRKFCMISSKTLAPVLSLLPVLCEHTDTRQLCNTCWALQSPLLASSPNAHPTAQGYPLWITAVPTGRLHGSWAHSPAIPSSSTVPGAAQSLHQDDVPTPGRRPHAPAQTHHQDQRPQALSQRLPHQLISDPQVLLDGSKHVLLPPHRSRCVLPVVSGTSSSWQSLSKVSSPAEQLLLINKFCGAWHTPTQWPHPFHTIQNTFFLLLFSMSWAGLFSSLSLLHM